MPFYRKAEVSDTNMFLPQECDNFTHITSPHKIIMLFMLSVKFVNEAQLKVVSKIYFGGKLNQGEARDLSAVSLLWFQDI